MKKTEQNYLKKDRTLLQPQVTLFVNKERYISYMTNNYLKSDGKRFKSVKNYLAFISDSLEIIGVCQNLFYSTTKITQLKLWKIKLTDQQSHALRGTDEKKRKYADDCICAFDSHINFVRHQRDQAFSISQQTTIIEQSKQAA